MGTAARTGTGDLIAAARTLEELGWQVVPTTSGVTVRNPHGDTAGIHASGGSDVRNLSNIKADLRRIGFDDALDVLAARKTKTGRARTAAARTKADKAAAKIVPGAAAAFSSASTDDVPRPSSHRGMMMRLENISPARAEELLARAVTVTFADGTVLHQRKVLDAEVRKFLGIIERDEWLDMPDGISFAPDGSLLNGRHRLTAVVKSGQTLPFHVHYNVPVEMFAAFDTARTRTASDTLTMQGHTNTHWLGSSLKLATCYDLWAADPAKGMPWRNWGKEKFTNYQVTQAAQNYPGMGDYTRVGVNFAHGTGLVASAIAVFHFLAERAWPEGHEQIKDFLTELHEGQGLRKGDAAYTLREWAHRTNAAPQRLAHRREVNLLLLLKAWNYTTAGRQLKSIPRHDEEQPMVVPYSPRRLVTVAA